VNSKRNSSLTAYAKELRKNMTKEERHLWYDFLKLLPVTVNRQKVMGNFIVDFYCDNAKLVIELDGSQHYEEIGKRTDELRDQFLHGLGITVLRYSNLDINKNFAGVCRDIWDIYHP
jgi:very-short-patch-repair endonuclease